MKSFDRIIKTKGRRFLLFVETSTKDEDYQKYEDLRQHIWEEPEDHFSGHRNMAAENYFAYGGSLFTGVYADNGFGNIIRSPEHFAGFTYGYVSPVDKKLGYRRQDNLRFYSQYAAVRPDLQHFRLGTALKRHQAEAVENILGVHVIACTFDPLTGVNANRNIHKLGMRVEKYITACYQNFGGVLNRTDVPADRFFLTWSLRAKPDADRPPVIPQLISEAGWALRSHLKKVPGRRGPTGIIVPAGEIGHPDELKTDYVLVEIPENFYQLLQETGVDDKDIRRIPLDWRIASRRVFTMLLKAGFAVTDFQRFTLDNRPRNVYVLKKAD